MEKDDFWTLKGYLKKKDCKKKKIKKNMQKFCQTQGFLKNKTTLT